MESRPLLLLSLILLAGCPPGPSPNPDGGGTGCTSDKDCSGSRPRCDKNASKCVSCLPNNDNCPQGSHCVADNGTFTCSVTCTGNADCPPNQMTCCNTACVDTAADPGNCGACGMICNFQNAGGTCAAGACTLGSCNPGFADCDNVAANGCEVGTDADIQNCGGCGHACAGANATLACMGGMCLLMGCNGNFADCDGMAANGCESNTQTDPANCGQCGRACPMNNACAAGVCRADDFPPIWFYYYTVNQ